jgi:hypothetical protein
VLHILFNVFNISGEKMKTARDNEKVVVPEYGEITVKELKQILSVKKKISKRSPALKATLFGKFYEVILEQHFVDLGFQSLSPKRVKWKEDVQQPMSQRRYNFNQMKNNMVRNAFPKEALSLVNEIEKSFNQIIRERKEFRPDFLLEKGNKYYIVEAKSWPEWKKELDWAGTVLEVGNMPQILACYARHGTRRLNLSGFILVWYSRSRDHDSILRALRYIVKPLNLTFNISYIDELLPLDASKRWFQAVVSEVRKDILTFLNSVERGKPEFRKPLQK